MKIADPVVYLKKIIRNFELDPLNELDLDHIKNIPEELDKRITIAKSFVPKIEKIGNYDTSYDLAATIVLMLMPSNKRIEVTDYISKHYNITKFFPWNVDCINDLAVSAENYYHPVTSLLNFAHPARPRPRFKDFSKFLKTLRSFKNLEINSELFEEILYYYAWKSQEFSLNPLEIEILNSILPFYSQDVEEINLYLENLYSKGASIDKSPKYVKELVDRMGKSYKTVRKHLDELISIKLLRQVLWVDSHYYGMQSLLFMIPTDIRVKSNYSYRKYKIKSTNKKFTLLVPSVPIKYLEKMHRYVEKSCKISINAYKTYIIPICHFSLEFYNPHEGKTIIDWNKVDTHFKECEYTKNNKMYEPVKPTQGDIDLLTLKIFEYLQGNTNVSDQYLKNICRAPLPQIKTRREQLESHGIRFPFVYGTDQLEVYFIKVNASTIGEINYLIKLLSIFPYFNITHCQNINDPKDAFVVGWLHMPVGSFPLFKLFSENELPIKIELYYIASTIYYPAFRIWELFNDKKKEFEFDFNKFKIFIANK